MHTDSRAQPAFYLVATFLFNRYQGSLFSLVKWPVCGADHLPSTSYEVKNECDHTPNPPVSLHDLYMYNFTFYMIIAPLYVIQIQQKY